MLIVSNFLLWILVSVLLLAVIALSRQVSQLRERLALSGPASFPGLPTGELAPLLSAPTLDGSVRTVGGPQKHAPTTLLLFVAVDCALSRKIIPAAMVLARAERLRLTLVSDGAQPELLALADRFRFERADFLVSSQMRLAYQVGLLPAAVLIGPEGQIVARAEVRSREQLESLIRGTGRKFALAQTDPAPGFARRAPVPNLQNRQND